MVKVNNQRKSVVPLGRNQLQTDSAGFRNQTTKSIMELYKISVKGNELDVLFMNNYYVFHSAFYGYVAIAERNYYPNSQKSNIALYVGNRHIGGGSLTESAIIKGAKRLITKCETKYNQANKVDFFVAENCDCNNSTIILNVEL